MICGNDFTDDLDIPIKKTKTKHLNF